MRQVEVGFSSFFVKSLAFDYFIKFGSTFGVLHIEKSSKIIKKSSKMKKILVILMGTISEGTGTQNPFFGYPESAEKWVSGKF